MISRGNYFAIFILLLMVFVMFMFAGVSSNILSDTTTNGRAKDRVDIGYQDTVTADTLNIDRLPEEGNNPDGSDGILDPEKKLRVAILSTDAENVNAKIFVEWCVYNKYLYNIFASWPEVAEMERYDIILFDDYNLTAQDSEILYVYAELGTTMIFTQLPDYSEISANQKFSAFFGIKSGVSEEVNADGIKIFPDFMISKGREYSKGDYFGEQDDTQITVPYYSLAPGYEVYSVGILDRQDELGIEDKDLPPLLWRSVVGKSFVFAVNSDVFCGVSLLGILTGFMAHEREVYLYPVVNAQTISLLNYPYFSNENSGAMQQRYSRGSEAVARDLLWPNIIQILKNYGNSYSFFAAPQLDYLDEITSSDDYIDFYLREIGKLPGDMGLSLGQVSDTGLKDMNAKNELFFKEKLPNYDFTALYAAGFEADEVEENLDHELLKEVSLVMSDYREGESLLSFLNERTLSVKFNLDGYQHETMDDLRMSCIENALGMCNVKVDIGRVIFPESNLDEWNYLSLKWSRGDTYFNDFNALDMVSIYEMEKRVKRFLALDYTYENIGNDISIQIENFDKEAYFILCTYSKSVTSVENASVTKISATSYLVKAEDANVKIHLKDDNVLKKPRNNKTIPSNPNQD